MKATYFYSEEQKKIQGLNTMVLAPNGKEYTELQSKEGVHKSNFNDAIIVQVVKNLPLDKFMLEQTGERFADYTKIKN